MTARAFVGVPVAELKPILLAFVHRRAAEGKALNDLVLEALDLPPIAPDEQYSLEAEFMAMVDDLAAELAASRLMTGDTGQPLLAASFFASLVDEYVEKIRFERANNIGADDPLLGDIERNLRTYLEQKIAGTVGAYARYEADNPYDVWGNHLGALEVIAADEGCSLLEVIENDDLFDEFTRNRYEPDTYRDAFMAGTGKTNLREITDAVSLNSFFSLMDATLGGDGELPDGMKTVLSRAAEYLSAMAKPIIKAYADEQVARLWPMKAP